MKKHWYDYLWIVSLLYLILGLSVTLLVILIMKFLFGRRRKSDGSGRTDHSSKEGKK